MNERALIAFLLLISLVILANVLMIGIVRSFTRGDTRWIDSLRAVIIRPSLTGQQSLDELHQKVLELGDLPPVTDLGFTEETGNHTNKLS